MKFIAIVFGIFIAIGVIGSMGSDEETSGTDTETTAEEKTDKKDKKEEAKVYQIGDLVETGKLAYKVTNAESKSELKSDNEFIESATTTGQFILIDIEAFNNDKDARMIDSSMFKILDDQSREFNPSSDSEVMMVVDGAMDFFLQDINPGLSKTGQLVFELPADAKSYSLQVSSGFGWSGGEYETIKLK